MKNIVNQILDKYQNQKFIYICGNSGAGKSVVSRALKSQLEKQGKIVNLISVDDFLVTREIRHDSKITTILDGTEYVGKYTSCCKNAYNFRGLLAVLKMLEEGMDAYILSREEEYYKVLANADVTIIEGIGVVFLLLAEQAFKVWLECDRKTEIDRRVARDEKWARPREEYEKSYDNRIVQFKSNIEPYKKDFDLIINTGE